jgi:hypothetical protein
MITHVVKALVDRGSRFWLITAVGFASGALVIQGVIRLPYWVLFVCTVITVVTAVATIADSIRYSMTTIRAARARRRLHGH